jgi:Fe-S-cluster containining protein
MRIGNVLKLLNERYKVDDLQSDTFDENDEIKLLSKRLGIEIDKVPKKYYGLINSLFPKFVKEICSKVPKCGECFILYLCNAVGTPDSYHNKFNCTKCGYCCTLIVNLSERDIKRIENQGYKKKDFVDPRENIKLVDNQCVFLYKESGKYLCLVYEHRPNVCRVFPSLDPEIKDCNENKRLKILHKLP